MKSFISVSCIALVLALSKGACSHNVDSSHIGDGATWASSSSISGDGATWASSSSISGGGATWASSSWGGEATDGVSSSFAVPQPTDIPASSYVLCPNGYYTVPASGVVTVTISATASEATSIGVTISATPSEATSIGVTYSTVTATPSQASGSAIGGPPSTVVASGSGSAIGGPPSTVIIGGGDSCPPSTVIIGGPPSTVAVGTGTAIGGPPSLVLTGGDDCPPSTVIIGGPPSTVAGSGIDVGGPPSTVTASSGGSAPHPTNIPPGCIPEAEFTGTNVQTTGATGQANGNGVNEPENTNNDEGGDSSSPLNQNAPKGAAVAVSGGGSVGLIMLAGVVTTLML